MHFKLSAQELEILDDRDKIVALLRASQGRRSRPLRPPILVVAADNSKLVAVVEKDEAYIETDPGQAHSQEQADEEDSTGGKKGCGRGMSASDVWLWLSSAVSGECRRWLASLRRLRRPRTHDRQLRRHERRLGLADGLAMGLTGAVLSAGGPVVDVAHIANNTASWMFFANPKVSVLDRSLTAKCDVCVISNYAQVFVIVDALLGAGLTFKGAFELDLLKQKDIVQK